MCICAVRKIKLTLTIRYPSELLSLQQMCSKFQCALTITIYFNVSSPDTHSWEPNSHLVEIRGRLAIGISVGKIWSLLCLKAIRWMQNERKWMHIHITPWSSEDIEKAYVWYFYFAALTCWQNNNCPSRVSKMPPPGLHRPVRGADNYFPVQ